MSFKKDKILQVRVSEKALEEIEQMAVKKQMNISDFIRYCILYYSVHKQKDI